MMKKMRLFSGMAILLMTVTGFVACNEADQPEVDLYASVIELGEDGETDVIATELKGVIAEADDEITPELAAWLQFMREEEKLAGDVYTAFYGLYNIPVFNNISRSEATHANTVKMYLDHYGIEDPETGEAGVYQNETLQTLYNDLIAQGSAGLVDALKVGALIEEVDIADLVEVYELGAGEDLTALAEALMLGSRNHLRAFTRNLKFQGVEYEPVVLSVEDYEAIVNSAWERGSGLCRNIGSADGTQFLYTLGRGFCRR